MMGVNLTAYELWLWRISIIALWTIVFAGG